MRRTPRSHHGKGRINSDRELLVAGRRKAYSPRARRSRGPLALFSQRTGLRCAAKRKYCARVNVRVQGVRTTARRVTVVSTMRVYGTPKRIYIPPAYGARFFVSNLYRSRRESRLRSVPPATRTTVYALHVIFFLSTLIGNESGEAPSRRRG